METHEFFSIFSHFSEKFLGTISLINHHSNNRSTSPLEYLNIIIFPIFLGENLVAMATRQHHRVLILGLINYQRSHDLIFKLRKIKSCMTQNFI